MKFLLIAFDYTHKIYKQYFINIIQYIIYQVYTLHYTKYEWIILCLFLDAIWLPKAKLYAALAVVHTKKQEVILIEQQTSGKN